MSKNYGSTYTDAIQNVFKALSDTKLTVPQCSTHQKIVDCVKRIQDTDRKTASTGPPQNLIKAEIG